MIQVIGKSIIEVDYSNGKEKINYRVAEGSEDISGVYNNHSQVSKKNINGIQVTLKGENLVNQAIWNRDNKSYSLYMESGVSVEIIEQYSNK
ncbi:hypothetical protein P4H61_21150 [Paenibacillus peoriae]|uniref:hypothetical protein n=1 Tax=Paenibacillus peoriae TaxID=59893 RepID=UPI00026C5BDB|nr:hypothetical protein [Paenibacillus peoriae]MEC0183999.1 hypothetical protein [Paenibacillus peoriae]